MRAVSLPVDLDPGITVGVFDDVIGERLAQVVDHGGVALLPDQALDIVNCTFRIHDRLSLGLLADKAFELVTISETNHRRGRTRALGVGEDKRLSAFDNRDTGVCGPQVDTDNLAHMQSDILEF